MPLVQPIQTELQRSPRGGLRTAATRRSKNAGKKRSLTKSKGEKPISAQRKEAIPSDEQTSNHISETMSDETEALQDVNMANGKDS